jgi:parallel beta-helix repeat protein
MKKKTPSQGQGILLIIFLAIISITLLFFYSPAYAYEQHEPILIADIHATADDPYIIEGYEITNPKGDCIKILNSEHVIIRNNYLHDCGTDETFQKQTDHYHEGYATLIGNSSDISFENNKLDNNYRGFIAYSTLRVKALNNDIRNTIQYSPLWCERCSNSEFGFNYLSDNGNPTHFWVPGDRSIGIGIKRSDNVDIHDNTVIRSTSDGIAVTGHIYAPSFTVPEDINKPHPQADWTGLCNDVRIYNNILLDNMEQGVWLVNDRNIKVYNNTIRTGCFSYGSAISTEFNVGDSEFYNNKFLTCNCGPPGGANSFNIYIHDNIYYSYDRGKGNFMHFSDDLMGVGSSAMRQEGAVFQKSYGNREENNKWVILKDALSEEMKEKRAYAETHKTYEAKGWFSCELPNGTIDEECRIREEAKGNQGVPREQLFYSSLMENFDDFVVENEINQLDVWSKEKQDKEKPKTSQSKFDDFVYEEHDPIIVENIPTTPDNPYVIKGYEITNPGGPCIQIKNVEHVIIRENYIHDCGIEISEEIQEKIKNSGDARLAMMNAPDKTGGINVFNPLTIEISNNNIINNDYGIRVAGYDQKIESANIYDNIVHSNHRSHFIWVQKADNVNIYNNDVRDNGLFIANEALVEAFEKGEDYGDGRSQGIITDICNHVKIFNNTVINSSSDGIAAVGDNDDLVEDIEIFNNIVIRNAEQGIWIVAAKDGKIHHNIVRENTHRIDTTGGSSGIMFEGDVSNFEIFSNNISYNDMVGVYFIDSPNNEIYDNEIHHNGDGAFGWGELFHFEKKGKGSTTNTIIRNNNIHHNRRAVFIPMSTTSIGETIVENNIFEANGGNPIHYEDYDDFDVTAHPEDWEYDGVSVFLLEEHEDLIENFNIRTNTIDGEKVIGKFGVSYDKEYDYPAEKIYATLFFITLIALIIITILYFRKKR